MDFTVKTFGDLNNKELHDIYQLRAEVFIVEQQCFYQDVDGKDVKSLHVLLYEDEQLIAYSRLLPATISYKEPSIGRVVVKKNRRGTGLGIALMKFSILETMRRFN